MKWFQGKAFSEIFSDLRQGKVKVGSRYFTMESTVDLCENAIGYEGTLIVGAISVVTESLRPSDERIGTMLKTFQKRLKYGLNSSTAVSVYELGFADRPLAEELAALIGIARSRKRAFEAIRLRRAAVVQLLESYPSYFRERLKSLS